MSASRWPPRDENTYDVGVGASCKAARPKAVKGRPVEALDVRQRDRSMIDWTAGFRN